MTFLIFQIIEPVSSLHLPSNQFFSSANENDLLSKAYLGTEELDLFQRGLDNQKISKRGNENAEQVPALDYTKAISSIGQIQSPMLKPIRVTLTKIMNTFGESPVSDLFGHIRNLIRNANALEQYPRIGLPSSDAFKNNFTREALLVAVGELSNESIVKGQQFLQTLKRLFKNTEMEALFTNIMKLLENQPILQKYAELSENLDKALELDKPLDLASLGLPIPTEENPVVYFQLKDDASPSIKFLVKVKLEEDQIVETILIKTDESQGRISSSNTFTASNDEKGLADLYKRLPISKLAQH